MVTSLLVLLIALGSADAATVPPDTSKHRGSWTLLPILFSSPDTGFGFGVLPQYVFRATPTTRASNVRMDVYYTQERQFNVTARAALWQPGNRYRLSSRVQLREWPTTFYGIGNATADDLEERYTERSVHLSAEVQGRVRPGVYAGARLGVRHSAMQELEPGGLLASGAVTGGAGGQAAGLGFFLSFDTRDEVFFPTQGHRIRVEARGYAHVAGADFGFTQHRVDVRQYLRLHKSHVLALQAVVRASTGTPPFQMLYGVGQVVRGYPSKLHADRHLLALQAEYRVVPLVWRFGLAFFVGTGQVAHDFDALALDRFYVAYGAGLRFVLIRSEKVTIRWDFGFGAGSTGDYLDLNEAF